MNMLVDVMSSRATEHARLKDMMYKNHCYLHTYTFDAASECRTLAIRSYSQCLVLEPNQSASSLLAIE